MKVKIIRALDNERRKSTDAQIWYTKYIGEVFEITDIGQTCYGVNNHHDPNGKYPYVIYKDWFETDCEIVER